MSESNILNYVLTLNGLAITNNAQTEYRTSDYISYVSLYGVSFERKVYQPGHIRAEIMFSTELLATDSRTGPDMDFFTSWLLDKTVSLSVDGMTVAKDYFIHGMFPQLETRSYTKEVTTLFGIDQVNMIEYIWYIKLDIFSPDKKMTLNKYSRAHLGRSLVKDIVKNSLCLFGDMELDAGTLQHLSYPEKKDDKTIYHELVQPYLVQYNETFYDFINRVANRCGEPVFYENGLFCVGMPSFSSSTEISDASRVVFQLSSSGPVTVKDYARDAVKEERTVEGVKTYELGSKQILSDPVELSDANPTYKVGEFPYNSEISPEDQYMILFKDKFARDDLNSLWVGDSVGKALEVVSMILESTSLLELITDFATTSIHSAIKAHTQSGETNKDGNESIDDKDYKVLFMKTDLVKDHWVTLKYHQDIRNKEEEQMRKEICVDMGEKFHNVRLGDMITIPHSSEVYVVTRIEMTSGVSWQRTYGDSPDSTPAEAVQSQRIYAIPTCKVETDDTTTYVFYPPLLPISPFRHSGPQPAFVVDSGDWKSQGRVRVRFPWQPNYYDSTSGTAFTAAETKLKTVATIGSDGKVTKKDNVTDEEFNAALKEYNRAKANKDAAEELLMKDATPWIRMSTPMATSGGGMYFKPEKGDEVMVDFENGNVEHPYVVGTLYSKNVTVPDGSRIIQSKNGHTIKMSDPKDGTMLLAGMYPGLKLLKNYGVKMDFMDNVCNEVLGGIEMTDKYGFYQIKMSSHDRCVSISSPFGDVKMSAFSGIKINAPNGDIKIVGKNVDITAYNKFSITSGKNIKLGLDKYRLGYLGTFTKGDQVGEAVGSLISSFYASFFDLSFIRSILEVFIRPVDGTLSIKSNRYLMMEAGKGKAVATPSNYNQYKGDGGQEGKNIIFAIPYIRETLDNYVAKYCELFNEVNYKIGVFFGDQRNTTWPDALTTPGNLTTLLTSLFALNPDCLAKSETFNSAFDTFSGDTNKIKFKDGTAANKKTTILLRVKALMRAVLQLKKYHLGYETMFADLTGKGVLPPFGSRFSNFFRFGTVRYYHKAIAFSYTDILKMTKPDVAAPAPNATATSVIGSKIVVGGVAGPNDVATPTPAAEAGGAEGGFYKTHYLEVKKYIDNSGPDDNLFAPGRLSQLRPNTFNSWKKIICRRLVCAMIEHCRANDDLFSSFKVTTNYPSGSALFKPLTPFTDHDWAAYVSGIDFEGKDNSNWGWDFLSGLVEGAVFDPLSKLALFEISPWKADAKGEILFSDKENVSFRFADNGSVEKTIAPGRVAADVYLVREALNNF